MNNEFRFLDVYELSSGDKIYCETYTSIDIPIKILMKKNNYYQTYTIREPCNDTSPYCSKCNNVINLFRFMERNYDTLRTNPDCLNVYQYMIKEINLTILDIELGIVKCKCWHCYSWRVTEGACLLTSEYKNHQQKYEHISKKQLPSSAFNNRTLYRLQHNNFMYATKRLDSDDEYVKKHDYKLILEELKFWRERFSQEPLYITNAKMQAKMQLEQKINNDCINNVLEFVF